MIGGRARPPAPFSALTLQVARAMLGLAWGRRTRACLAAGMKPLQGMLGASAGWRGMKVPTLRQSWCVPMAS